MDKLLYEDIKYGSNIVTGDEYLETMVTIADIASEMVVKTLGPYGKTTIIDDGTFAYPTKDGWNVLKRFRLNDPIYNTLFNVLRQVSFDLVNKVGDGTTSAFIGATIFIHKVLEYETHVFRQSEFIETLNRIKEDIIQTLKESKYVRKIHPDGDFNDIYKIAYVSSNGNRQLSEIIREIYQKTQNPNIYVTLDSSTKLSYEIQTGYKLDCLPVNQRVYRNSEDGTFTWTDPGMVAIFDHNVNYNEHDKIITAISRYANQHNTTVFILAPHFDDILLNIIGTAINSMINQNQIPNIMLIQVPLSMNIHRAYLSDVVLLTNAQVIDYGKVRAFNVMVHNQTAAPEEKIEDALLNTEQYHFDTPLDILTMCLGKTRRIVVGEKHILLQHFEQIVNPTMYANTMLEVEKTYQEMKEKMNKDTHNLQKDFMDAYQHYTKLHGNMGVIKVGGASELEKHCLKDSVDDAVLACRSAFDHGYIRGLNLATMNVIQGMIQSSTHGDPEDYYTEFEVNILRMLYEVFFEMSLNVLRNKHDDTYTRTISCGQDFYTCNNKTALEVALQNEYSYDLVTETFVKDEDATVINSTLTDVEVLNGMVSILSTMLTSNQLLSINRTYDRTVSRQKQREMLLQNKEEEAEVIAKAVLKAVKESEMTSEQDKTDLQKRRMNEILNAFYHPVDTHGV